MSLYIPNQLPSNTEGLKYIPSFNSAQDDADHIANAPGNIPVEFSDCNVEIMRQCMVGQKPKAVLEIGVNSNALSHINCSTRTIFDNKSQDCIYIGLDIQPKQHLDNKDKNIYTIHGDSADYQTVYDLMKTLNIEKFDLIFIDGWHSINQVVKEWKYTEHLAVDGCLIFHDTNWHPGPYCVFDAIDEDKYIKDKLCVNDQDNGISVCFKK
jgi:cephalosporin hydroxylase